MKEPKFSRDTEIKVVKRNSHTRRIRVRQALALASLIIVIVALLPSGAEAAAITEYELPPGSTKPYGITIDNRAATSYVLVAVYGSDKIARLNPSLSTVTEFQLPTSARPWDVVYDNRTQGPAYRIWFTESQRHMVGYLVLDGSLQMREWELSSGAGPRGMAIQYSHIFNIADSMWYPRIWFAEFGTGAIGALTWNPDLATRVITEWYLPDSNCGPLDIIYLNSSGLWFTEYQGHRIGNFNPVTNETREWPLPSGSFPWGIANDTYGNLWFTLSGRNRIGKLNPYTNEITEYYIPTPNADPYEIVVDRYNNVWFTEHGVNRIARFSPGTNTLVEFERSSGGAPMGVAYAYDGVHAGTVWFTEEVGNRIGRIDDTEAKTTITVTSKHVIATQSTTATTVGSSVTSTTDTPKSFSTTGVGSVDEALSTTTYRLTETSSFLKTSYVVESTSTVTYTATTTATATSYVTTVSETSSVTATSTKVETSLANVTGTSTSTSYISTSTASGTTTTISTSTITKYSYATEGGGLMIPGYPVISIVLGLAAGFAVLFALGTGRALPKRFGRYRWLAAVFAASILVAVSFTPAAEAAMITEWSLPSGSTMPLELAFDDQSPYKVWFAEFGSDKVGRLDHISGEIFEIIIPPNSQPWGVAFESARHEVWFTMSGRDRLGAVTDYGNNIFELTLPSGSQPRGLGVEEHVNGTDYPYIWVALYGSDQIARVDPYYGEKIVYWNLTAGRKPQSIIFSPDTGVWFTEDGTTPGKIGNLNPATGEVKEWNIPGNGKAWALTSVSGFMWFTDYANNHIGRLNPYTGEIILYRIPTSNSQPYGIAVDSYGDIWFAAHAQNRIGRLSPDSLTFEEYYRPTGGSPWSLAISNDGKVWFTDDSGNKICRIDPTQALATTTVTGISTASKTTSTTIPVSSTISNLNTSTTVKSDPATTRTAAPTTVTTTYGLTETIKVLQTSTTTSNISYITATVTVLGDLTVTNTTTASTYTTTETTTRTSTSYTYTTISGTFMTTKYTTVTTKTTLTTTVETSFELGMIPGYSAPSIVVGLLAGSAGIVAVSLRRLKARNL